MSIGIISFDFVFFPCEVSSVDDVATDRIASNEMGTQVV